MRIKSNAKGNTGALEFECLWMDVDSNAIGAHAFSAMDLARVKGHWLVKGIKVGRVDKLGARLGPSGRRREAGPALHRFQQQRPPDAGPWSFMFHLRDDAQLDAGSALGPREVFRDRGGDHGVMASAEMDLRYGGDADRLAHRIDGQCQGRDIMQAHDGVGIEIARHRPNRSDVVAARRDQYGKRAAARIADQVER